MKKVFIAIFTFTLLILTNYFLSSLLKVSFLDMSLISGILFTAIIGFFSTEDNIYNRFLNYWTAISIDKEVTRNYNLRFFKNIPFFISLTYTITALIVSLLIYWEHFF